MKRCSTLLLVAVVSWTGVSGASPLDAAWFATPTKVPRTDFLSSRGPARVGLAPSTPFSKETWLCVGALRMATRLRDFFAQCPAIEVRFRESVAAPPLSYRDWSEARKNRLDAIWARLVADEYSELGLSCPSPKAQALGYGTTLARDVLLSSDQAFDVFAAHVAHALLRERQSRFRWSIFDLTAGEKAELFDSYAYFSMLPAPNTVTLVTGETITFDRAFAARATGTDSTRSPSRRGSSNTPTT